MGLLLIGGDGERCILPNRLPMTMFAAWENVYECLLLGVSELLMLMCLNDFCWVCLNEYCWVCLI